LVPTGQFSTGETASSTVEVGLGESVENAYFIKMISTAPGGSVINYSGRFSISGMTGQFPDKVTAGLKTVTGTDGPATENNIQSDQQGAGNAAGADGDFAVPYTMQTGVMRYAPMPKVPPTKITAKNPTPLYPTSAVQFAAEMLPNPTQKTTVTQSVTFSVESMENTVRKADCSTGRRLFD
jgi:Yeast cell wall synthesis protein KRE9/KNH1